MGPPDAASTRDALDAEILRLLARHDEPVLLEMEAEAEARGFPAVGRSVGVVLELLARAIGARRVFELGSGFGYSAYWFCRAVGSEGEVHLTEFDPTNVAKARAYLGRAGVLDRARFNIGDALEAFAATPGEFDVVFCDIDKADYPRAWAMARERIRPGGLWICDNTLGFGSTTILSEGLEGRRAEFVRGIREHNAAVAADPGFVSEILPIRDGVMVALRVA